MTLSESDVLAIAKRAHMTNVRPDLRNRELSGLGLYAADLQNADCLQAAMQEINLSGANLTGANLSHADLTQAHLYRANCSGADLSHADLTRGYGACKLAGRGLALCKAR